MSCVAIIGLGLMGGSVARAVRAQRPHIRIIAIEPNEAARNFALKQKFVDEAFEQAGKALSQADMVIYAVPVDAIIPAVTASAALLKPCGLVMDVASVKEAVAEVIAETLPRNVFYVPAHPIAGSERSGVEAAQADLFKGKRVILTPTDPQSAAVKQAAAFWTSLGGTIEYMPAALHDRIYGAVSHLPQYLAFAVGQLYAGQESTLPYSETLAKFLRLTASDRALWRPIFTINKINIDQFLQWFLEVMHQLRSELGEGVTGVRSSEFSEEKSTELRTPNSDHLLYGTLLPYLIASALVSVVYRLERELNVPVSRFAGTGFADFTAPLAAAPEPVLDHISQHACEVRAGLDHFVSLLTADSLQ